MTSFQAKTGWKMPRKRKKKLSVHSVPTRSVVENSNKIAKKFKKKKYHYGFLSSQNRLEKAEKEKI